MRRLALIPRLICKARLHMISPSVLTPALLFYISRRLLAPSLSTYESSVVQSSFQILFWRNCFNVGAFVFQVRKSQSKFRDWVISDTHDNGHGLDCSSCRDPFPRSGLLGNSSLKGCPPLESQGSHKPRGNLLLCGCVSQGIPDACHTDRSNSVEVLGSKFIFGQAEQISLLPPKPFVCTYLDPSFVF
ncbi:uncharacterized protein IWZ02DRAFT_181453 [Phyllosticta citriasiana]|uniref:uncharacterized protein n=1 Tax=Phyllosticta citriasiana TaxID=595635 RepID=UPI0030FD4AC7